MKKTLLLALLGASTLVVASGKVETVHSSLRKATLEVKNDSKELKFSDRSTEHQISASITENNITAHVLLKTTGETKTEGKNKKLVIGEKGLKESKLGLKYDDKTVDASLEYDFNQITVAGGYTYKKEPLTVKPSVEYKLKSKDLKVANKIGYDVSEKLSLENNVIANTKLDDNKYPTLLTVDAKVTYKADENTKLTDVLTVEKSLSEIEKKVPLVTVESLQKEQGAQDKGPSIKSRAKEYTLKNASYTALKNKLNGEIKLTKEVQLYPELYSSIFGVGAKNGSDVASIDMEYRQIDVAPSIKITYTPEAINGLKADAKLSYGYMNGKFVSVITNLEEPAKPKKLGENELKTNKHSVGFVSHLSYEILKGLTLTPEFGVDYTYTKLQNTEKAEPQEANPSDPQDRNGVRAANPQGQNQEPAKIELADNKILTTIGINTEYKYDKYKVGLKLESKINNNDILTAEQVEALEPKDDGSQQEVKREIAFKDATLKAILSLSYEW